MSFTADGLAQLKLKLERLAFVPAIAEDELKLCALELRDKSRDMAPIDYGDLKKAIQIARRGSATRNARGHFIKGESTFDVFVNGRTPVSDPDKLKEGITLVADYAWEVHAHMGWAGNNQALMPSDKSVAEGRSHNVDAGGAFLERAAVVEMPKIHARLAKVVFNYTQSLDK